MIVMCASYLFFFFQYFTIQEDCGACEKFETLVRCFIVFYNYENIDFCGSRNTWIQLYVLLKKKKNLHFHKFGRPKRWNKPERCAGRTKYYFYVRNLRVYAIKIRNLPTWLLKTLSNLDNNMRTDSKTLPRLE